MCFYFFFGSCFSLVKLLDWAIFGGGGGFDFFCFSFVSLLFVMFFFLSNKTSRMFI